MSIPRWFRIVRRIALATVGVLVVVVALAVGAIHTDRGRELVREQVVKVLDETFVGGVTIGTLEGSPFGELVARDVVIGGPDHQRAIAIGTLRVELALLPLLAHHARLEHVVVEDLEIRAERDASGGIDLANLLRPGPSSRWRLEVDDLEIRRGHLTVELGGGPIDIDDLAVEAAANVAQDEPLRASFAGSGRWRQRAMAVDLAAQLAFDGPLVRIPVVSAHAGGGSVLGLGLTIDRTGGAPSIDGALALEAPAKTVARIAPAARLPGDLALSLRLTAGRPAGVALFARVGDATVRGGFAVELAPWHAAGLIETLGAVELAPWGAEGRGGVLIAFDGTPDGGRALISARGELAGVPVTSAAIAVIASRRRADVSAALAGPNLHGVLQASGGRAGDGWALDRSSLVGSTDDPASLAELAVHGDAHVDLAAHGRLWPDLDLAVRGTIMGEHLRMAGVSVRSLRLAIDATGIPSAPRGQAKLAAVNVARGSEHLSALAVDVANQLDGRLAVSLRAHRAGTPSLVEIDALVELPQPSLARPRASLAAARTGTTVVELLRHRIYAGPANDWTGASGQLVIGPAQIVLRELRSASAAGSVAVGATLQRTGPHAGDLNLAFDAKAALDKLRAGARGAVAAHGSAARVAGQWQGDAKLTAAAASLEPWVPPVAGTLNITARPRDVTVDAELTTAIGAATLALGIDAPADLTDVAAWQRLDRTALRTGRLVIARADLGKLAVRARLPGEVHGQLDADLALSATAVSGVLHVRKLVMPSVDGELDADLAVAEPAIGQLAATLTATLPGLGELRGEAELAMPARPFDPAAWQGVELLREASLRVADVKLDPALLARFGVHADVRGRLDLALEVGEGARTAQLAGGLHDLRIAALARPIELALAVVVDASATSATLGVRSGATILAELAGHSPIALARWLREPRAVLATPLAATLDLPAVSAPELMKLFGRAELTTGTISGTATLGGTLGAPTLRAKLSVDDLAVAPRLRNQPRQTVKHLELVARWDDHAGSVTLDGSEDAGGRLHLSIEGARSALAAASSHVDATRFDLTPLLALAPGPAGGAAGTLDGKLALVGLDPATATGELHLIGARLPSGSAIGTLRDARIDLTAAPAGLAIAAAGKLGAGTIKLDGKLALTGATLIGANATIALRNVSAIGAIEPVVDADVTLTMKRGTTSTWAMDVVIEHANIVVPDRGGEALKPVGAPFDMVLANGQPVTPRPSPRFGPKAPPPPVHPVIVATVVLRGANLKTEEVRGVVDGALVISLDGHAIGMTGAIQAARGDLDLFGRRYNVERAAVHFDGSTDPLVDVRISHDFAEVTTVTEIRGRLSKPDLTMSSDPATYSQGQLLGFLLGGEPSSAPYSPGGTDVVTSAGASVITGVLGGYVKKALPIDLDVLRYDNATAASSASVTIGRWLTRSWFLAYRQHLAALPFENQGEAEFEYWLSRHLMVEGVAGDRGNNGVDLLWRERY